MNNVDLPMIDMIVDGKERSTLNYFNNSVIVGAYGVFGTT
jgi:hypothetical protein